MTLPLKPEFSKEIKMSRATSVFCNVCGKRFALKLRLKDTTVLHADELTPVKITFFRCPHCGHLYIVAVSSAYIRHLMEDRQVARALAEEAVLREALTPKILKELAQDENARTVNS